MLEGTAIRRRVFVLLGAALVALAGAAPASADDPPRPDEISAADAYRESLPTAAGPRPTGRAGKPVPLAPGVAARLGSGETLLRDVAVSPAYGAPPRPLRPPARDEAEASSPDVPSLSAAGSAVEDAVGRSRVVVLAALLLGIGVGAVAARLLQVRAMRR